MKYWIIIILSFLSFPAEAQKIDMPLAAKLLDKELAFFVSAADSDKVALLIDKADLYKAKAEHEKALSELERAEKISVNQNTRLRYEKMLNYFLSNQFNQSASIVLSEEELRQINREKEYFIMRIYSLNENEQWIVCKEKLLSRCSTCDSVQVRNISSLPVSYDFVSPLKCRILSDIVPGLGMIKAGKPFKGVTSFLIQSGLALGAGYCFYTGYYVAGVVSGVFPLLKFHKGGIRLSGILAENRNEKEKRNLQALYNEQIKKVVYR